MNKDAFIHIEEAYRLLTGKCYRGSSTDSMEPIDGICTLVMDLKRVDAAIGSSGESMFARIADTISAVYVEIKAARKAMEKS